MSDLRIDQILAGELAQVDETQGREHLGACNACRQRFEVIEAEQKSFAATAPAFNVRPLRAVAAMRKPGRSWARHSAVGALALAAAALLAVWIRRESTEWTGIKGGESIGFFVKHGDVVRKGGAGERVQAGDVLRFTYSTTEARYLALVSTDGAGTVSVYFPLGADPVRVAPGRDVALESAVELDAVAGQETVRGFFCESALAPAVLAERVRRREPVAQGCVEARVSFEKAVAP